MSTNLNLLSQNIYWKEVGKLFTICRRNKIKPNEVSMLVKYPYLRNKQGCTLFMYALEKGHSAAMIDAMMNSGHKIIDEDIYDVLEHNCYSYNGTDATEYKIKIILEYIIKNNMVDKNKITKNILKYIGFENSNYEFIKYIVELDIMGTDLDKYDIVYHTYNMDIIKLFESKFIMNEPRKDAFYHIIQYYCKLENYDEKYIKRLASRNPECVKPETINHLIMNIASFNMYDLKWSCTRNLMHFFKIIYSVVEYDQNTWNNVVAALKSRAPSRNKKMVLLAGYINGYIKDLDLGFIKGFNIDTNDFKRIMDKKIDFNADCNRYRYNHYDKIEYHMGIHGLYLFK